MQAKLAIPGVVLCRAAICVVLTAGVVACHGAAPTRQEQMQAAQDDLLKEAMAVQQCQLDSGFTAEKCLALRAAYDRDLAAFKAKYGR